MSAGKTAHRQALRPLLEAALRSEGLLPPDRFTLARFSVDRRRRAKLFDPDIAALEDYLIDHGGLPGPAPDWALVEAFADEVAAVCRDPHVSLRQSYVSMEWLLWLLRHRYPPALFGADPESPLQLPELCGAVALGEWAVPFRHIEAGVGALLDHAQSPLPWVREACARGLQRMLRGAWTGTYARLRRHALDADAAVWRTLIAATGAPELLRERAHALDALALCGEALAYVRRLSPSARRRSETAELVRTLGTTLGVVVSAAPEVGFAQLWAWAAWDTPPVDEALHRALESPHLARWSRTVERLRARLVHTPRSPAP